MFVSLSPINQRVPTFQAPPMALAAAFFSRFLKCGLEPPSNKDGRRFSLLHLNPYRTQSNGKLKTQTCRQGYSWNSHICIYVYMYIIYMCIYIYMYTHIYVYIYIHTYVYAFMHVYIYTYTHTYIHSHAHTQSNAHTHIFICLYACIYI